MKKKHLKLLKICFFGDCSVTILKNFNLKPL